MAGGDDFQTDDFQADDFQPETSTRPNFALNPPGMPHTTRGDIVPNNPILGAGKEDILGPIPDNLYTRIGARIKQNLNLPAQIPAVGEMISGAIKQGVGQPPTWQEFNQKVLQPFYAQYKGKPENVAGDVASAFITGGGELPIPSGRRMVPGEPPISPEMALTSAMRKSPKGIPEGTIPAMREAAGYLGVQPEHFQGPQGVQLGQKLISHALDVHESNFAQLLGPIRQEAITPAMLGKYPDLADYLGATDKPTTVSDINAARIAKGNQFYSKGPATQQGATGNLLDAKKINSQAREFLYDYIQKRTGVDPTPLKNTESSLLRLKPIMDRTAAETLKAEADFQMNPQAAKSNVIKNAMTAIRAAKMDPTAALDLLDRAVSKHAPSISPAEAFNAKMRLTLGDIPRGGPPAMRAPNLVGGQQQFAPAPTQFGGRTGESAVDMATRRPPVRTAEAEQIRNALLQNQNIPRGTGMNTSGLDPATATNEDIMNWIRQNNPAAQGPASEMNLRPRAGTTAEVSAEYNPQVVQQHGSALEQAKAQLPNGTLSEQLQLAAKIQRGGQ